MTECEKGNCDCANGRKAYLEFYQVCETPACPERALPFVSPVRNEPCRRCKTPTTVKHAALVKVE